MYRKSNRVSCSRVRRVLLSSTLLCSAIGLPTSQLNAQDADVELVQPGGSDSPLELDAQGIGGGASSATEIVVTGSRLRRTDLAAPSPTTVVGESAIALSGSVTIENTVNEFPQLAAGQNSNINAYGGSGVLTANLRGLGATRTLVLVNGRRFIPANSDGSVDLASIPDALVERVEIVTGGASAVYGSDAIAGAVNFILKPNFTGLAVSYMYGMATEGDGASQKLDVTFGADLDGGRGNVTLSAAYTDRKPVFQADRAFSRVPLDTVGGVLVPGGSGSIPGTRIGLSSTVLANLNGVDLTPSGQCTAITGIRFGAGGTVLPYCTPQDAYNYSADNYLLRPLERTQLTGIAHYEVSDGIEAYGEAFFMNNNNAAQQAPDQSTLQTPGLGSNMLLVPNYANNPSLNATVRQFFVQNANIFDADGDGNAIVINATRRSDELGPRHYDYERTSYGFTGGLRGNLDLFGSNWEWDSFYQYQRTRMDQLNEGQISLTRLAQSLDSVVDATGRVVCRDPSRGCVPASVFGIGALDPAAGAFLTPPRASKELFTRHVAGASLSGTLLALPAGDVPLAFGVEYRKDSFDFQPSSQDLAGEYGHNSLVPVSGHYSLKEVFGETRIPILADMRFADMLALEAAARYADYSTVGGVFAWKIGGEWAPVDWLRFRGAYNSAIRAPTLNELYSPIRNVYGSGEDPCVATRNPTQAQQQLCVAQGVPAADIANWQQGTVGISALTGGNPHLKEEKSKTWTIGAVFSPPFIPKLNLTIDYFNIDVEDAVATVNTNQTLNDCFFRLDPNAATCRSIVRLPNGQIDFVRTNLQNVGKLTVRGVDAQLDYRTDLPDTFSILGEPASLTFQIVASWMLERSTEILAGQPALDCAGRMGGGCTGISTFGTPKLSINSNAGYQSGPLTVRTALRRIGVLKLYPGTTAAIQRTSPQYYFDISGQLQVLEKLELFGGIDNLFDNQPPVMGTVLAGDANTDPSLYDVVGRRFFAGARLRF